MRRARDLFRVMGEAFIDPAAHARESGHPVLGPGSPLQFIPGGDGDERSKSHASYPSSAATALPAAAVSAAPPRSRVRVFGSASACSIALTIAAAASASPRCSSIMAADQI